MNNKYCRDTPSETGHPTAEDVARVEVGLAGYQLS